MSSDFRTALGDFRTALGDIRATLGDTACYRVLMARRSSARVSLGEGIAAVRKAAGLEVSGLAERMGLASRTLRRWEAGTAVPSRRLLGALVETLATLDRPATIALAAQHGLPAPTPAPAVPPVALTLSAVDAAAYLLADALAIPASTLRPGLARFLLVLEVAKVPLAQARATLAAPPSATDP